MGDLTVDRSVRRALSSESRVSILKSVSVRRRTQSELARELNLASPTILQHLSILLESGLMEKIDEGRKWKYYQLTEKGRSLLGIEQRAVPVRSIILFAVALVFIVSSVYMLQFYQPQAAFGGEAQAGAANEQQPSAIPADAQTTAAPASDNMKLLAAPLPEQSLASPDPNTPIYYAMFVFGTLALLMALYVYWQNRQRE